MTDFVRLLVEIIGFIWPFRMVDQWEAGVYYVFGKATRVVGPGVWPVVPWFMEVRTVNVVPDVFSTEEQTIELQGSGTLTFSASVRLRVTDASLALNHVVDHEDNAVEDVAAVLADTLAEMPEERLEPEKRRALLRRCIIDVNKVTGAYGIEVEAIRFTNFIRDVRAYRLITSGDGRIAG